MSDGAAGAAAAAGAFVELAGVSKGFAHRSGRIQALVEVDLAIARGEFISLIGPSGCGKTTLLRLAGGLLPADQGQVTVAGTTADAARRSKQFGFVPQTPALLPWRTVRQNVRLLTQVNRGAEAHPTLTHDETEDLLRQVGLGDFLDAYPRELSGGMQQRVSLVRAFALAAPILLMDEPFAALDEITRGEMRYLLLQLWERSRATVLFVTHSITEAVMLSDRVVVLAARPGRITAIERIGLARPRHADQEDTLEFLGHVSAVRHALLAGSARPV
jgi:NitT/TauT family transport system ATP-binding protein